jgi:hypothetical protein
MGSLSSLQKSEFLMLIISFFHYFCVFKKIRNKFFDLEKVKKPPSKVAHNRPPTFFFSTVQAAQTAQKQKSRTTKSPLMQDWVFRLGL